MRVYMVFRGRCLNIRDVCMDFEPGLYFLNVIFHVMVSLCAYTLSEFFSVYRPEKKYFVKSDRIYR